jgi:pyrrolidone-carboxylate peptidase
MYLREGDMTANGKFEFKSINPNQTEIAWIDSGNVGNNPIKRYMIPMVTKSTAETFKQGLTRIKQQLETNH